MATTVEIILKATDKASKTFKEVGKSAKGFDIDLKKIAVAGGAAVGVLGAVAVAGKQAFEFGKQGAAITQTAESFDLLMDKVGATPGLLDDLRDASRGTISDFELMSSTATLLAGASGELGTELANATPQLMEIAKAANKLNPALGDTAFMYNSIATGVKRAQPLILDNLGLTIKVGAANEAMAKKLGKSVEALTAEEKSLAILNATLEAGDVMIDQVGGSVDSATDSFARLETNVANLVDTLKQGAAPALSDNVEYMNDSIKQFELYGELLKATDNDWMGLISTWWDSVAAGETTGETIARIEDELFSAQGVMMGYVTTTQEATTATEEFGGATGEALESTSLLSGTVSELAGSFDAAKAQATLMNDALKSVSDGVADAEKKKLILALATGELTDAEVDQSMAQLATLENMEILNKQVDDGKISWGDYAVIVADGVISQDEMTVALGGTIEPATNADAVMEALGLTTEETSDKLNQARLKAIALQAILAQFHDIEFTVTGNFVMNGFGGSSSTPSGGVGGPPIYGGQFGGPGGQHGLSMTVPGGYPNDTFPIRASSGEHVEITPKGGGSKGIVIINNYNNSAAAAAMAYDEAIELAYREQNEVMGV